MNFAEALSYLLSLGHETLTIKLGLANTETLLAALGNPHKEFPAIQIAGTNGKGSTAVTLDAICREAGIRTGLFTSPHLISITERISIDGEPVSEADFARFTAQVRQTAEELVKQRKLETLPTFFEHVTAIALLAFRAAKVDLAILETGLGGRLDSTTAARADIVAITSIAMDHEEYLGHSLAEIAAEKAAIIRPGVVAIIARQDKEALDVIVRQCEASGVGPGLIEPDADISGISEDGRCRATFETPTDKYANLWLGLRGRHQIANVATAIGIAEVLREQGFAISRAAISKGVGKARHPGRLELWEGRPRILFDGAHNPAAARALRSYLDEFVTGTITMIFGAMRDKALNEMAAVLFPVADQLILTELDNPRAASLEMLKLALPEDFNATKLHQASSTVAALRIAKEVVPADGLICVTGSLYLVGTVQQALKEFTGVAHWA
ncbi:MAG TPA: folylpolyglutamate synthase/dihydrofolate synthase family protein [Pyrinomonadaceae bacterium]|nr:folylpolyglutamate synthase/dihydrofolate synthase family protein [Pyrinomonadaceae bacterium]